MKKHLESIVLYLIMAFSQPVVGQLATSYPESKLTRQEVESHLRFLASDELQGRKIGELGNSIAARYIAEQLRILGLKPAPGQTSYYQNVSLQVLKPAKSGSLKIGTSTFAFQNQFAVIAGGPANLEAETVYVGYGLSDGVDGYNGRDVKGKIVVAQVGPQDPKTGRGTLRTSQQKSRLAAEKGAVALLELYANPAMPWNHVVQILPEQLSLSSDKQAWPLLTVWVDNGRNQLAFLKEASQQVSIQTSGRPQQRINSVNVAGIIEGADPKLRHEYIMLSAHYDHLGTAKPGSPYYSETDSIFNGTRDNAMGVVGLLSAAKALKMHPPKRSVIIMAYTAEEGGGHGSRYYAENPLVPLNQTVFNLNIDNAGYNDTSIISVIGLERTGVKKEIEAAAKTFGLKVVGDPAPEQNLFDRSDNASLAVKGIPAPTFSTGFRQFDEEITRYYHRTTDNPDTIDFYYLLKFCQAYTYAARLIANRVASPRWVAGDKYEQAAKELYGF